MENSIARGLARFRRIAVAAFGAAVATGAAAVHLDPGGQGQVLVFPYYTAQSVGGDAFNTYLTLSNSSSRVAPNAAKILRVRFREGRNGREVASFNLYLGPDYSWAGAVVPTGSGARLIMSGRFCATGPLVAVAAPIPTWQLDFTDAGYSGARADGLGGALDRTREGYVEVFEMATLSDSSRLGPLLADSVTGGTRLDASCPAFDADTARNGWALPPTGGLSGTLTLINVTKGMDFTVAATALADVADRPYFREAADPYPDFDSQEVSRVSQFVRGDNWYRATWPRGVDAVASALMADSIGNETVLDTGTRSGTDWIVTFPLKRFGLPAGEPAAAYPPSPTAGVPMRLRWRSRDGGSTLEFIEGECGFLCPPGVVEGTPRLPWAASVVSFATGNRGSSAPVASSTVLGSRNAVKVTLPAANGSGAAEILFSGGGIAFDGSYLDATTGASSAAAGRLEGAPAVGFMLRTFENGLLNCAGRACQGNYGGSFPHFVTPSTVRPSAAQ